MRDVLGNASFPFWLLKACFGQSRYVNGSCHFFCMRRGKLGLSMVGKKKCKCSAVANKYNVTCHFT